MRFTENEIEKLAVLARLELTAEERRALTPQIAAIIAYVEQLNEVDTSAVEPAIGGLTPEGERTASSRDDVVQPSLGQRVALEEAPDPAYGYFRVPKVI
ncbi:MAG: Asp-tRNA(Asn)/Glu-tRNA(Gln) amidotransferase subunit GatB [Pyrinomonas sp.]|uniref:Asp-tRNA(Asn)/Glu-tRNA(Gln) amidotransferase subunit GatC n=1 Tax=Pyrinomonas sp. TaxID=2080306 RepID=UPI00332B6B9B